MFPCGLPVVGMVDTFFVGAWAALSLAGQGAANAAFNFCFCVSCRADADGAARGGASARGDDGPCGRRRASRSDRRRRASAGP